MKFPQKLFLILNIAIIILQCKKESLDVDTSVVLESKDLAHRVQAKSQNILIAEFSDHEGESEDSKTETYLIRERFNRDSDDYFHHWYYIGRAQISGFKIPNLQKHIWSFEVDAQYTFLWRPSFSPFYVTVANHNETKSSPRVYSVYNIKNGNLLVSGNHEVPITILEKFDKIKTFIGYHSGGSMPKAVVTWDTDRIREMQYPAKSDYEGILTVGSNDKNLQKFAIFSDVFCMKNTETYLTERGKRLSDRVIERAYEHKSFTFVLKLIGYEECPGKTYKFAYDFKTGKINPLSPKRQIRLFE